MCRFGRMRSKGICKVVNLFPFIRLTQVAQIYSIEMMSATSISSARYCVDTLHNLLMSL